MCPPPTKSAQRLNTAVKFNSSFDELWLFSFVLPKSPWFSASVGSSHKGGKTVSTGQSFKALSYLAKPHTVFFLFRFSLEK